MSALSRISGLLRSISRENLKASRTWRRSSGSASANSLSRRGSWSRISQVLSRSVCGRLAVERSLAARARWRSRCSCLSASMRALTSAGSTPASIARTCSSMSATCSRSRSFSWCPRWRLIGRGRRAGRGGGGCASRLRWDSSLSPGPAALVHPTRHGELLGGLVDRCAGPPSRTVARRTSRGRGRLFALSNRELCFARCLP